MKVGKPMWGFLATASDYRIAVSPHARDTAASGSRGVRGRPERRADPAEADPHGREHQVDLRRAPGAAEGLHVLLRAWPEIRRRTGARLRIGGADPLAVRLLLDRGTRVRRRHRHPRFLSQEELTAELLRAKALVAPSLGGESFGMVLTRRIACATPVIASDIDGTVR
jgi:phosphatidylinositol alpha-mannosyltransferase